MREEKTVSVNTLFRVGVYKSGVYNDQAIRQAEVDYFVHSTQIQHEAPANRYRSSGKSFAGPSGNDRETGFIR